MSLPEVLLWRLLRKAQPPIRRQHPIGDYVVDFYCAAANLVLEVDGFAHDTGDRPERDNVRQRWLEDQGLRLIRIAAPDVLRNPEACADSILRLCEAERTPPPQR
jgi:very-short-patch-repair endonuclease